MCTEITLCYALNVFVRFSREVLTETRNTEFFVEIIVIVSETECDAQETSGLYVHH